MPLELVASILAAFSSFSVALVGAVYALRHRSLSKYDKEKHEVDLSAMRDSYESQIGALVERLTSTEQRWRELNHLVISGQQRGESGNTNAIDRVPLLRDYGFSPSEIQQDSNLVFVLTPFNEREASTYSAIKHTVESLGFRCARGDEVFEPGDILRHTIRFICKAEIVIANISDRNANVFYELGVSHALGKKTILVSRTIEGTPFNVRSKRIVVFSGERELQDSLVNAVLDVSPRTPSPT